jgi:hypothetical protein
VGVETADDLAGLFSTDDFGETVTYTPPGGGTAQSVVVIWDDGAARERVQTAGQVVARRRSCSAPKASFSPAPEAGGTITRAGVDYRIRAVEEDPGDPNGAVYHLPLALTA